MAAASATASKAPLACAINGEREPPPFANTSYQARFDGKDLAWHRKSGGSILKSSRFGDIQRKCSAINSATHAGRWPPSISITRW